jgi:LacI family sucrose operon transcriptional repressor
MQLDWNRFDFPYRLEKMNQMFNEYPHIDGFFCTDLDACAALKVARQRGVAVPKQLRIVSYDGTYIVDTAIQTLTVVVQPIQELALHSVNAVLTHIEGKPLTREEIVLDVFLKEGETA